MDNRLAFSETISEMFGALTLLCFIGLGAYLCAQISLPESLVMFCLTVSIVMSFFAGIGLIFAYLVKEFSCVCLMILGLMFITLGNIVNKH